MHKPLGDSMEELTAVCQAQTQELAGQFDGLQHCHYRASAHTYIICVYDSAAKEAIMYYLKQKVKPLEQTFAAMG